MTTLDRAARDRLAHLASAEYSNSDGDTNWGMLVPSEDLAALLAQVDRLEAALTHIATGRCKWHIKGSMFTCLTSTPVPPPGRWCPSCVATVVLLGGDDGD